MNSIFRKQVCCVCGSDDASVLLKDIVHTKEYDVMGALNVEPMNEASSNAYLCHVCGHVYLNPIVSEDAMNAYYSKMNSKYYSINKAPQKLKKTENEKMVAQVMHVKRQGRVLEIGCGYGFLLEEFRKAGFDTAGVEPSPLASSYARTELSLQVINDFLQEGMFPENYFDVVVLFDVAEHVSSMRDLMTLIKKVLKSDGLLVLGTGNIDSRYAKFMGREWWYLSAWEHISFFSPKSVRYLLENHGFDNIQIQKVSHMGSVFKNLLNLSKSLIKVMINPFLRTRFSYNLCFDHMIAWGINRK